MKTRDSSGLSFLGDPGDVRAKVGEKTDIGRKMKSESDLLNVT